MAQGFGSCFLSLDLPGRYQVWAGGPPGRERASPTQADVSPAFRTGSLEPASGPPVRARLWLAPGTPQL
ncbi:hypothetical protein CB1_000197030 [Camelus ferus]|nr:hypothetical protein CB1_000197030 [Camelus ferus]